MRGENRLKTKSKTGHCDLARPSTSRNKNADLLKPKFVSAAILSAPAYSPHYFPFKHHYLLFESVNLFRTLNRATIGHLHEGGRTKFPTPGAPQVVLLPSLSLGFRVTPGRYFVKWRPTMIKCVRI